MAHVRKGMPLQMAVNPLSTIHQLRRFSSGLSRNMPVQPFKRTKETTRSVPQRCRGSGISSRNYSVVEMYPPTSSLSLEAASAPGRVASEPQPVFGAAIDLAHEKVENWTSRAYADVPFRPDFTLFEPVEPLDNICHEKKTHHRNVLDLKSRLDTSLSDRLVYLIRDDPDAAEQLRSEIIKNGITLPINIQITSYCFDFLFEAQNISSYLEWLPLVAPCHLQQVSSLDTRPPISISEVHLNHILKSAPLELSSILKFLEILIVKECYSRYLGFAVIKHLVRTQTPATTISATEKIFSAIKKHSSSAELVKSSYDFLVVQLANQGHLSDALQMLHTPPQQSGASTNSGIARTYPLVYKALADQLISRIKDDSAQSTWSDELDKLISRWRADDKPSLSAWLAKKSLCLKSLNLPPLTKQISRKYVRAFSNANAINPEVCHQISSEKLHQFTSYFRSLFDQNEHPKFVKAAQLANEIHQILPLRHSFQILRENLQKDRVGHYEGTEEQIIKSFVLEPRVPLVDKIMDKTTARMCPKFTFETRSDIVFLWAHSWMIFYHRSGQPRRAIQIFLDYFIPIGCDVKLLHRVRWGPNKNDTQSRARSDEFMSHTNCEKYQKLIHPSVGVLTVLYDSILSICPPKLIPIVFDSFLAQHFHRSSDLSSLTESRLKRRLEPNMGSFRPFVRAHLKAKDVDGALKVLESMHTHLDKLGDGSTAGQDEGGWIDLLEWCAINSPGPQPKTFDPSYQWGDQRKRKIKGWDGKMKEELIYLVLQKFFFFKLHSSPHIRSKGWHHPGNFFENSQASRDLEDGSNDSTIGKKIQELKIFRIKNASIESKLNFLVDDHPTTAHRSFLSSSFPSLKLISKLKFAFYLSKNSNGLKVVNQLSNIYK
ncbi:hypothetical protein VP01_47g3 [Puccinia sorghi]|uniref:Uncharacterized protein n=1 Tax=Puccinia sorghi TaxID=27349 RepID=A0A0L6UPJ8_9BASI|nr:hypothetical protein VP01_47g3 [Puccinia sorghi]